MPIPTIRNMLHKNSARRSIAQERPAVVSVERVVARCAHALVPGAAEADLAVRPDERARAETSEPAERRHVVLEVPSQGKLPHISATDLRSKAAAALVK